MANPTYDIFVYTDFLIDDEQIEEVMEKMSAKYGEVLNDSCSSHSDFLAFAIYAVNAENLSTRDLAKAWMDTFFEVTDNDIFMEMVTVITDDMIATYDVSIDPIFEIKR